MSILKKTAAGLSTTVLVGAGIVLGAGSAMADPADALTLNQPSAHDISADAYCDAGWGGTIVVSYGGVAQGSVAVPSHGGVPAVDTIDIGYVGTGRVTADLYCNTYEADGTTASATATVNQEGVLDITPSSWSSGDTVTITGSGFGPGTEVAVNLYKADSDYNRASDEVLHSWTVTADGSGAITLSVVLPYDESGNFRLEAAGVDADGASVTASVGYYWNAPESAGSPQDAAPADPAVTQSQPENTTTKTTRPQSLPKTGSGTADLAGLGLAGGAVAAAGAAALRRRH
ncbi:LPXTG cell wall anchor domain-containing protein [uncultured Propionibacterium sp.]|uniref:LPXTG cell wall anchor domain-containing protein n=1 Tax=uncultured Propionibacterium sp. TaxID=218066 RepID=UPI00292E2072|nr:LPXTG cell wall anchor domain-containing protein [uncultured Propionibacterium sp.]